MDPWNPITTILLAVYFMPAVIYSMRSGEGASAKMVFTLLNGAFNWTVIGWLLFMNASLDSES